jgi:hypothetical protein
MICRVSSTWVVYASRKLLRHGQLARPFRATLFAALTDSSPPQHLAAGRHTRQLLQCHLLLARVSHAQLANRGQAAPLLLWYWSCVLTHALYCYHAELKRELASTIGLNDLPDIHQFLDGFYLSRIGIRMLIGQHIALHEPQRENHIGAGSLPFVPHSGGMGHGRVCLLAGEQLLQIIGRARATMMHKFGAWGAVKGTGAVWKGKVGWMFWAQLLRQLDPTCKAWQAAKILGELRLAQLAKQEGWHSQKQSRKLNAVWLGRMQGIVGPPSILRHRLALV